MELKLFDNPAFADHEQVVFCSDAASGLRAIIAVHSTRLGPAIGGTRMFPYTSEAEALRDVLRLSAGMTLKAAAAGVNYGGGKAVIIGDPATGKSPELLRAMGRFVERLGGGFLTAEDVGMTEKDLIFLKMETSHLMGLPADIGGGGDPSPTTALGVFHGIRAAARQLWGRPDLQGRHVAVQGLGSVGWHLCHNIHMAGGCLTVSDIDPEKVARAREVFGAQGVAPDGIYAVVADIFAPCAMGGILNQPNISRLKVSAVVGGANNQLEDAEAGQTLHERGVLYAPDFVVNAGGMIRVVSELSGYDADAVDADVAKIADRVTRIFESSAGENLPPAVIAMQMAQVRLKQPCAA